MSPPPTFVAKGLLQEGAESTVHTDSKTKELVVLMGRKGESLVPSQPLMQEASQRCTCRHRGRGKPNRHWCDAADFERARRRDAWLKLGRAKGELQRPSKEQEPGRK